MTTFFRVFGPDGAHAEDIEVPDDLATRLIQMGAADDMKLSDLVALMDQLNAEQDRAT